MLNDLPTSPREFENSSRYNPKVIERKLNGQTEWAELTRQQQYYAEQMIQQEKDKKAQQRSELNEVLGSLVQQKETQKKLSAFNEKQEDFTHSLARKQEYDQHLEKLKNDKIENQKFLADDYSRKMWLKEEENRKRIAQEKQVEEKMISDALDSLQREKAMKDKMRNDFTQSVQSLLQEKEAQRRREEEKRQQDREEHRRLMNERARNLELQESNYKLYFQKINDNQSNRQQVWDQTIGQSARSKDRNIDGFIERGIEEARRKAEMEEALRQQKKQDQIQAMRANLQSKIQEHEDMKLKEKLGYKDKVEELMRQNQQSYNFQEQLKKEKANHTMDYKTVLENQVREAEEQRRKFNLGMVDQEKKLHTNFDGLIPGIRNSKMDPHARSERNMMNSSGSGLGSPYSGGSPLMSPYTNRGEKDEILSVRTSANPGNPFNTNKSEYYNPITNPIPLNNQNPYLNREFQRGGYQPKNVLVSAAGKGILG